MTAQFFNTILLNKDIDALHLQGKTTLLYDIETRLDILEIRYIRTYKERSGKRGIRYYVSSSFDPSSQRS